ncbi:MAG: hypothetical protein V4850_15780 [Myxococcota bacterium]
MMPWLLLVAGVAAMPWWTEDAREAEAVRAALVELWPTSPFVVQEGAPEGLGAWYGDGVLHLVLVDGVREGPVGPDAAEQVVIARAWLAELGPERRRWAGRAPIRPQVGLLVGTGVANEVAPAPLHVAIAGDLSWRLLTVTPFATGDLGTVQAARDGAPVNETRVGVGVAIGTRAPLWGGELALVAGPTVRLVVATARGGTATVLLPGIAERVHWWRAVAPGWRFGVGATVQFDGIASSWKQPWTEVGDTVYARPELVAALEIGLAWANP